MIKGTYKLISDEQLNERIKRREDEIKQLVYDEYENYKKFIEFDGLPPILEIVVENIPRVDASVRTKAQKFYFMNLHIYGMKLDAMVHVLLS